MLIQSATTGYASVPKLAGQMPTLSAVIRQAAKQYAAAHEQRSESRLGCEAPRADFRFPLSLYVQRGLHQAPLETRLQRR